MEAFSDDLNLKIDDLLLHPLYHATRKTRAKPARACSSLCMLALLLLPVLQGAS